MTRLRAAARSPRAGSVLVLIGVVAVAANLRAAITLVGPLVPTIRADLDSSNVGLGLVGTIPVLAFAMVSPLAPALGRRIGIGRSLAASMLLLAVAIAVRSAGGFAWLVVGTAGLGVAIAIGNVLLPALIKGRFPHRTSQLTSAYTATMVLVATVSASAAVPIAEATSWELSAGIWAVPALLGAMVVIISLAIEGRLVQEADAATPTPDPGIPMRQLYRTPLAWHVTAFMGLQSTMFYVTLAWLSDVLISRGMTDLQAGTMVGLFNTAGLVGVLTLPLLHRGRPDQRRSTIVAGGIGLVGSILLLVPGTALAPAAAAMMGLGTGGTIALVLSFFALRTRNVRDAASLSGMAQTWGYLLAAAGPLVWGALRDLTGAWTVPLVLLVGVSLASTIAGVMSARDRTVA